jgi:hypothetical protein
MNHPLSHTSDVLDVVAANALDMSSINDTNVPMRMVRNRLPLRTWRANHGSVARPRPDRVSPGVGRTTADSFDGYASDSAEEAQQENASDHA